MTHASRRVFFQSASAAERLKTAREFVSDFTPSTQLLVVGSSREATDDFVREIAATKSATFGLHRFSLAQLVSRLAQDDLGRLSLSPATHLTIEALMARVTFGLLSASSITYLEAVARFPGFPFAAASTVAELRAAGLSPDVLKILPRGGADLMALAEAFDAALHEHGLADSAEVYRIATRAVLNGQTSALTSNPLVLLDPVVSSLGVEGMLAALVAAAPAVFATVPEGDSRATEVLTRLGLEPVYGTQGNTSSLGRLRTYLFSEDDPPRGTWDDTVVFLSAPGEGRECVELARIILREAERGISFDDMAILLRSPRTYAAHLETAMRRASIPLYVARGAKRPSPTGRAFLALLACATEDLSARRFAEYLSLGQVPPLSETPPKPGTTPPGAWLPSDDDLLTAGRTATAEGKTEDDEVSAPVVRAPRRWERLLVEAAVIGGRARWERRLNGLMAQAAARREELSRTEPASPRLDQLTRELAHLAQLKDFALPLVDFLGDMRNPRTWGEWLDRLRTLATRALRHPGRVLRLLAELEPLGGIGPVGIAEVRAVLERRLITLEKDQPDRRYGHVFVASIEQVRGRAFRIVFVPGLAERMFPQKALEDPLLPDDERRTLPGGLPTQDERLHDERLLLRLAAGAASERLYLSYPRLESGAQGRARVTSLYGLDIARAVLGALPHYRELEHTAYETTKARLAWPAPADATLAIDPLEYDLSVLHPLLHQEPHEARGRARFLMDLSPSLGRSLRARWQRWAPPWTQADGLVRPTAEVRAILEQHRLTAHPYSVSSLQRFTVCPYQFFLAAIHRLAPREELEALQAIDPLTRGHILHRIQADVLSELRSRAHLPLTPAGINVAETLTRKIVDRVSAEYAEKLAPAIRRLWDADIETIRMDVLLWVRHMAEATDGWTPKYFELGFGLTPDKRRDPASVNDPVRIGSQGCLLHGSIDLIEDRKGALRVTDYKTGRDRTKRGLLVGAGEVLQPLLYGLATEKVLGSTVKEGRLFFSTLRGGFSEHLVPLNTNTRKTADTILSLIDSAIEGGFLPPAPRKDACARCDFRPVCGPGEERRLRQKKADVPLLTNLAALRGMK
jgi:ATP-dependent helicase/nuclease subunit B